MTCLSILLCGGLLLTDALELVRDKTACVFDVETLRMFLGQERGLSLLDLVDPGFALDVLVDSFFLEWSRIHGGSVHRGLPCFHP